MQAALSQFGRVAAVRIGRDKTTGLCRAFGFATFERSDDADK